MRPPRLCMRGAEQSTVLIAAPRDAAAHLLDQSSATCTGMGEAVFSWQP